jgi:hypothetical protein
MPLGCGVVIPAKRNIASHAKPLDWKIRGEESDNTDPLAKLVIIRLTRLTVTP